MDETFEGDRQPHVEPQTRLAPTVAVVVTRWLSVIGASMVMPVLLSDLYFRRDLPDSFKALDPLWHSVVGLALCVLLIWPYRTLRRSSLRRGFTCGLIGGAVLIGYGLLGEALDDPLPAPVWPRIVFAFVPPLGLCANAAALTAIARSPRRRELADVERRTTAPPPPLLAHGMSWEMPTSDRPQAPLHEMQPRSLTLLGVNALVALGVTVALTLLAIDLVGSFGLDLMIELTLFVTAVVSWRVVAISHRSSARAFRWVVMTWAALSTTGCLTILPTQGLLNDRAEIRGNQIADALERFRQREGHYPESLNKLLPRDLPVLPSPGQRIFDSDEFRYDPDSDGYTIGHTGQAFTWCTRTASRREWYCLD